MAIWANLDIAAQNDMLFSIGTSGANNHRWSLESAATSVFRFVPRTSVQTSLLGTAAATTGIWHHVCGIEYSSTSRAIFTNGADKQTNTTSRVPAGMNQTTLGILNDLTIPFDGKLADAAIWNVALADEEVAALALGISPLRIRRTNLVRYYPLLGTGSPEPDWSGQNQPMTINGTVAAIGTGPPIQLWFPQHRTYSFSTVAAAAPTFLLPPPISQAQMALLVR